MAHYIPSMMALAPKTREAFASLPAEFTKKQYDEVRDKIASDRYSTYSAPMTLKSAREYGIVNVVRTEKTTYVKTVTVIVNPKTGEKMTCEQFEDNWCRRLAREFGIPFNTYPPYMGRFEDEAEMEMEGYRNIFTVDWNRFEKMCQGL